MQTCADRSNDEAVQKQLARWQADPFLTELITLYEKEAETNPIENGWVTLGNQIQEKQEVVR
jgi:hypothetical protein